MLAEDGEGRDTQGFFQRTSHGSLKRAAGGGKVSEKQHCTFPTPMERQRERGTEGERERKEKRGRAGKREREREAERARSVAPSSR